MTRTASLADLAGAIDAGPLAGFRNAIINGNFDIWQRGTSFSDHATNTYTADRWAVAYDGSGATRTISRQAFALGQMNVPGEPTYFFRFAQSVAGSGATYYNIEQRIESVRTFAGQTVTISFYAKAASSLTLPAVYLGQVFGSGGSPSGPVYIAVASNQSVGTTWSKYSFTTTLPSISGKTIGSDQNDYLLVAIQVPINTTFTFDIALVQLEVGPVATPFERRPIGTELALCQRYYETGRNAFAFNAPGITGSSTDTKVFTDFKVIKRAVPSISTTNVAGTVGSVGVWVEGIHINYNTTLSNNVESTWAASAEL